MTMVADICISTAGSSSIKGIFGYVRGCSKGKRLDESRTGWQQEVPMQKTLSIFLKNVSSKAIQRLNTVRERLL